jgi:hypothetical protein
MLGQNYPIPTYDAAQNAQQGLYNQTAPQIQGEPANILEALSRRAAEAIKQASMANDRIQRVFSRAFGDGQSESRPQQPRVVPAGALGGLSEQLDELNGILSEQAVLLNRLDTIV